MPNMMAGAGAIGGALTLRAVVTLANQQFLAALGQVEAETTRAAATMQAASGMFAVGALGIAAGLAISVAAAANFEQSMANMDSVARTTRAEFAALRQEALDLGTATVFSATEAADAMYWLASAGQSAAEIGKTLPGVLMLAAATQHDLASTTETVVSVLSAFRYEADETERVVNVLAATIGNSLANMDKLTESLKFAAPTAKAAGQSIESLAATLGLFFNAGLQGSMAGTAYRRVVLALLTPNQALAERIALLNGELERIDPRVNDLADSIDYLNEMMFDAGDVAKSFGLRGATAMQYLLLVGGDALREMRGEITATTDAQDMMRRQMDTVRAQITVLKNALSGAAIVIGEALLPMVREVVGGLIRFAQGIAEVDTETLQLRVKMVALAGATAGALSVIGRFAPVLGALAGPIALVAVGVGAWAAALTVNKSTIAEHIATMKELATDTSVAAMAQRELTEAALMDAVARQVILEHALDLNFWLGQLMDNLADADYAGGRFGDTWRLMLQHVLEEFRAANEETKNGTEFLDGFAERYKAMVAEMNAADEERRFLYKMAAVDIETAIAMQETLHERMDGQREERAAQAHTLTLARHAEEAESFRALADSYAAELQRIGDEADWVKDHLLRAMDSMADAMVVAVEEGSSVFKALGKAALSAFADMFESIISVAIAEIVVEQMRTAGILSIKGFLNPLNWALVAPAMAAGAAAIAAVRAVRSKLKFHEGGKPPREGMYLIRENEHVIDPHKARRGGYGSTYLDALGGLESIELHLHDVRIERDGRPVTEIAVDLADQLRGELARGGV